MMQPVMLSGEQAAGVHNSNCLKLCKTVRHSHYSDRTDKLTVSTTLLQQLLPGKYRRDCETINLVRQTIDVFKSKSVEVTPFSDPRCQ